MIRLQLISIYYSFNGNWIENHLSESEATSWNLSIRKCYRQNVWFWEDLWRVMRKPYFKIGLRLLRNWPISFGIPIRILRWFETRFVIGLAPIQIPAITNRPFVSKKARASDRGYQHRKDRWDQFELWNWLCFRKNYWDRGLMTEALKAVLTFVLLK